MTRSGVFESAICESDQTEMQVFACILGKLNLLYVLVNTWSRKGSKVWTLIGHRTRASMLWTQTAGKK